MPTFFCPECGHELVDINEGFARLRYGPVEFVCQNPDCPKNPDYLEPKPEKTVQDDQRREFFTGDNT